MHLCIFEDYNLQGLFPLLHTRAVFQLRNGARTIQERLWDKLGRPPMSVHTRHLLAGLVREQLEVPVNEVPEETPILFVNGRMASAPAPFYDMLKDCAASSREACLFMQGEDLVAAWLPYGYKDIHLHDTLSPNAFGSLNTEDVEGVILISRLWHLLDHLHDVLTEDLTDLTRSIAAVDNAHASVSPHAILVNAPDIYLAPSVSIKPGAILDATNGPIYLDEKASVMEFALVKGPAYIGPGSVVKAQANIEHSSLGPVCKVAGEVHSVIFQSYSNKAHAGFAGNSYIGSWCNLGADTNTSNLRNDYAHVSLYNESLGVYELTQRQFLGLIMGDHSKCGINTMFNTGTVVGVSANIYGSGFQPRYIPSFSWGCPEDGYQPYRVEKALQVAERVMARRGLVLSPAEQSVLLHTFEIAHGNVSAAA